jgi:Conserved TM helix
MFIQNSITVLQQSFYNLLYGVATFIPNFLFAVIIFLIGWFIAVLLGRVVAEAIRAIQVDHALKMAGVGDVVHRAGYSLNSGAFLGALVKWFVIIVFLMASLQIIGLSIVTYFLEQIVLQFLPQVIVAVLIILVAAVVAEVAQGVVAGAARAAGIRSAGFAGTVAKWAIWGFAIIAALSQVGIATAYFQTLFTGLVVALSLAFGLAFGLGGQEAAARFIEKTREGMNNNRS